MGAAGRSYGHGHPTVVTVVLVVIIDPSAFGERSLLRGRWGRGFSDGHLEIGLRVFYLVM
jgi:hypothetical protein